MVVCIYTTLIYDVWVRVIRVNEYCPQATYCIIQHLISYLRACTYILNAMLCIFNICVCFYVQMCVLLNTYLGCHRKMPCWKKETFSFFSPFLLIMRKRHYEKDFVIINCQVLTTRGHSSLWLITSSYPSLLLLLLLSPWCYNNHQLSRNYQV